MGLSFEISWVGLSLLCWHNFENNSYKFGKNNRMFTSMIKELLETNINWLNVMKYSWTLIDNEYERSNIASQKELGSISDISH